MKKIYLLIIAVCSFAYVTGQTFYPPVSIATIVTPGVYNLTPASICGGGHKGAIWCTTTVDFTNSFTLNFKASFDQAVAPGADGICVVFGQNITPTSINLTDAFFGYFNWIGMFPPNPDFDKSIGIEFDTYDNSFNPYLDDIPGVDHTSICINAVPTTPITGPIAISPSTNNVKDGNFHDYRVEWCPDTHTMKVFYNDTLRLNSVYDYTTVFTTPTTIHWGISGGTGAACSNQIVKNITLTPGTCGTVVTSCDSIALPDSIHACIGDDITLPGLLFGSDSVFKIAWNPATGLSDSTSLTPSLTAGPSGWYHLMVQSIIPTNLVANGDFSGGNTGFTSSYTYSPPPSTVLNEGFYSVYTDPYGVHTGFTSFGDHTTGSGNMMIINGGPSPTDVWCETITVTPNTDYDFSAWIANCSSITIGPDVPILQFKINGVLIGSPVTISTPPSTWMNFFQSWNSGTNTSATICIYDLNTSAAGNDFAIDDITFRRLCTAKDSIYVDVKAPDTARHFSVVNDCILNSPATLTATGGYSTYAWNTGSSSPSSSASSSGMYWVMGTAPCRVLYDTFNVSFVIPDTTFQHSDTSVCQSVGSITINAPAGYTSYAWNTGAVTSSINVGFGLYWVRSVKVCTVLQDTIKVMFIEPPLVSLGNDTEFCKGNTITLSSPPVPNAQYLWNTGITDPSIVVTNGGKYSLTVTVNGCSNTDSITVIEDDMPMIDLGPDTFLCKGEEMLLDAHASSSSLVRWSSGTVAQDITVLQSGTYWVTVTTACGSATDSIRVEFDLCDINFPSGFTPNGDGRNDVIRVLGSLGFFKDFSLSIFNRWGQRVYYSEDIYAGWDGVFNGTKQDLGTYFYMIYYTLRGKKHMMKGDFQLIR